VSIEWNEIDYKALPVKQLVIWKLLQQNLCTELWLLSCGSVSESGGL